MRKFGVIRNTGIEEALTVAESIREYLTARDCTCPVSTDGADLPEDTECALVLGGDGTLLRAAKIVLEKQIPLLGINLGTLGYLAELDTETVYPALERLLRDEYTVEQRMMLEGNVIKDGVNVLHDCALNDIYIKGQMPIRNYRFLNYVNGAYLNALSADGIILATATGSTGYSLSVGGPILSPKAEIIMMTPIAPHSLVTSRSILLPETDTVKVEIGEGRTGRVEGVAKVKFDGAGGIWLSTGDYVEIRRSNRYTNIIKINNISFLDILRRKMAES